MTKYTWNFTANSHLVHLEQWYYTPWISVWPQGHRVEVVNIRKMSESSEVSCVCIYTHIHYCPKDVHLPYTHTVSCIPEYQGPC